MQQFYKVYEILDNVEENLQAYPTYFVGAFVHNDMAEMLCKNIDIANCNSTKIVYGIITQKDIDDLKYHGLQGCDKLALEQITSMLPKNREQER